MNMMLLLAPLALASALQAQQFQVRLSPPDRLGHRYTVSLKGKTVERFSAGANVIRNADYRVEFEGQAEILQIDGKGQPVRLAFTVSKLVKLERDKATEVLPPGSVVLADGNLEKPIYLKEGEIAADVREALDVIYSAHKPGTATDDEIFGSKEARGIGESWPVNARLAAEDVKRNGIDVPPEHIHGTTHLVAKDSVAGTGCMEVRAEFQAEELAFKDLPPGFAMDLGNMDATIEGCFPSADSRGSHRSAMHMNIDIRLTSNDGSTTIEGKIARQLEETWIHKEK